MTTHDFEVIFDEQMAYCRQLLASKATEYAGEDRLSAFKEAAVLQETTPQQALAGMMAKHTQSVYKFCRSDEAQPMDKWEEKITDHINYLILLRALVVEDAEKTPDKPHTPQEAFEQLGRSVANVTTRKNHNLRGGCGPSGPRLVNDYANLLHQGKLREKRKARGETLDDVAKTVGVHFSAVSSWELGTSIPTQDHYDALVNHFYPYWHKAVQKGLPHGQNRNPGAEPSGCAGCGADDGI